jgi:hypothetical protein
MKTIAKLFTQDFAGRVGFPNYATPGKLLQIWRTSRIGRSLLLGPAFVLVDIVFGDQVYRVEGEFLSRLLSIHKWLACLTPFFTGLTPNSRTTNERS